MHLLSSPVLGLLCPVPLCYRPGVSVGWAEHSTFSYFFCFAAEYQKQEPDLSLPGHLLVFLITLGQSVAGAIWLLILLCFSQARCKTPPPLETSEHCCACSSASRATHNHNAT